MSRASNDQVDVFLEPGDWFVGDADFRIRTILGSCVSITLWHPASRLGGMCHFLLPSRAGGLQNTAPDGRYGDEALRLVLGQFERAGVPFGQCQAKVFGGGNMFPEQTRAGAVPVGQRNGEAARALLQAHGIAIMSESLYGIGHRQIIFDVANGDVWSHQVRPTAFEFVDPQDAEGELR